MDQHDLDHMDGEGYVVSIAYTVFNKNGRVIHMSNLSVDGQEFAAMLRPVLPVGPVD